MENCNLIPEFLYNAAILRINFQSQLNVFKPSKDDLVQLKQIPVGEANTDKKKSNDELRSKSSSSSALSKSNVTVKTPNM